MAGDLQTTSSADSQANQEAEGQAGKAKQDRESRALAPVEQLTPTKRDETLDDAIARYALGDSIYAIADGLGVNHTTLYRYLIKHRESEWREVKVSRALVELEDAEEALKTAPDGLALTRARERCRAAQWQLERLMRRIYGQDAPASATVPIQINIGIARAAEPQLVNIDALAEKNP